MIRLFAALGLPDDIAEALLSCQRGPKSARWRPRKSLHLTLRFFGEIEERSADALDDALQGVRLEPFSLSLAGAGAFVSEGGRGALYAGVAESEPLRRLAGKCETAARRIGLMPETRVFRPHVTLAYTSGPPGEAEAAWIAATNLLRTEPFSVASFGLYSSRLGRDGSKYVLEREYALR